MPFRNPLLATIIAFVFGAGTYVLLHGYAVAEPDATMTPAAVKVAIQPRTGVEAAADRLIGFNLLSNNPPVPDIEMYDVDGRPVIFDQFRGKVVLFNLWATWCPPCIREMPALNALQAQYRDRGFVVVPVASGLQGKEEPSDFLRKHGLSELTTYYDRHSRFLSIFDLETLPITFLIDRDGTMRGGVIGMLDWQSAEAEALIEALLDEQKT